jgi:hypothetical protein
VYFDNDPLIDRFPGWKHIYHLTAEGFELGQGEYHVNGWVRDKYLKVGGGSCPQEPETNEDGIKGTIPGMGPPSIPTISGR